MQLSELARGLAARGHQVTVATPPSETWAARCREAGLAHAAIPMRRPYDPRAAWRLARLIRQQRIQIAHAHKGRARTLTLLAGLMGARALLVLNRGVSFRIGRVHRVGYTSRRVHAIVAVCRSIKDGLVAVRRARRQDRGDLLGHGPRAVPPGRRRRSPCAASSASPPTTRSITQVGVRSWRGWSGRAGGDAHRRRRLRPRATPLRGRAAAARRRARRRARGRPASRGAC